MWLSWAAVGARKSGGVGTEQERPAAGGTEITSPCMAKFLISDQTHPKGAGPEKSNPLTVGRAILSI